MLRGVAPKEVLSVRHDLADEAVEPGTDAWVIGALDVRDVDSMTITVVHDDVAESDKSRVAAGVQEWVLTVMEEERGMTRQKLMQALRFQRMVFPRSLQQATVHIMQLSECPPTLREWLMTEGIAALNA